MLTGVLSQCAAAALCSTMSPSADAPLSDSTPVESTTTTTTEDATVEVAQPTEPALVTVAIPEAAPVEGAEEEISTADREMPEIVAPALPVMISAPVIQPLDVAVEIDAISLTPLPTPELSVSEREIECLALNIYHEARGEPTRGRYAVAWVTVNRMHSAAFPDTVCEVVYQSTRNRRTGRRVAQFSWIFQDPAEPRGATWTDAQSIARNVYAQRNSRNGTHALSRSVMYYHATSGVSRRNLNWFQSALRQVVRIGDHIFYRER